MTGMPPNFLYLTVKSAQNTTLWVTASRGGKQVQPTAKRRITFADKDDDIFLAEEEELPLKDLVVRAMRDSEVAGNLIKKGEELEQKQVELLKKKGQAGKDLIKINMSTSCHWNQELELRSNCAKSTQRLAFVRHRRM